MSQDFGMPVPTRHDALAQRQAVRHVMVTDSGGARVARLYLENLELVNEFDAAVNEVVEMTSGRVARAVDHDPLWACAMHGLSDAERASARVYTLT